MNAFNIMYKYREKSRKNILFFFYFCIAIKRIYKCTSIEKLYEYRGVKAIFLN